MKNILNASLFVALLSSNAAFATPPANTKVAVPLAANAYVGVGSVATNINLARQFSFTALPQRAGFVKNSFDGTLSANVVAGVFDNAANNRFGVSAGSNKGYNVFTGSSVGGSVAQCGDPIAKTITDLGASEVKTGILNLENANGCGR